MSQKISVLFALPVTAVSSAFIIFLCISEDNDTNNADLPLQSDVKNY